VRNVVSRISGAGTTGTVLLTAHYDSAPLSPGAGDNGAGVAALLETVRSIAAGPGLRNDLVVLFADGHGTSQAGLRAFVEHHPWMDDVAVAVSAEMAGVSGPALTLEAESGNGWLIRALAAGNPRPVATSAARALGLSGRPNWPHAHFRERGVPVLRLTAFGGRAVQGQALDRAEAVSERTLQHQGLQLLALTRALGREDLGSVKADPGSERAYLSLPGAKVVHHPADWLVLLCLVLLGVWVLWVVLLRLRGGSYQGVLVGLALGAGLVGISVGWGWLLLEILRRLHTEYGLLESALYRDGPHFLALAAGVLGLTTVGYGLARRRFGAGEIFLGSLSLPLATAMWLGFRSPFGAMALSWALVPALLSAGVLAALGPDRTCGRREWVAFLLTSVGILALLVPDLEVLATALTLRGAPIAGAAFALTALLLLPVQEWLTRPRIWWVPALLAGASAALIVGSAPFARSPVEHPDLASLVLLVEDTADGRQPPPPTEGIAPDPPRIRRRTALWLTRPGPGRDWARAHAVEQASSSTDPGILLLPLDGGNEVAGTGPEVELAAPRAWILEASPEDSLHNGVRRVLLGILPGEGGEMTGLHLPEGSGEIVTLAGTSLAQDGQWEPVRSAVHWGTPEGGMLTVGLLVDGEREEVRFDLLEHHLNPETLLGEDFFRWNGSFLPHAPTGSGRVVQRTRVTLDVSRAGG
jgi:hypothetical protein